MIKKIKCYLCGQTSMAESTDHSNRWFVECHTCGWYEMSNAVINKTLQSPDWLYSIKQTMKTKENGYQKGFYSFLITNSQLVSEWNSRAYEI